MKVKELKELSKEKKYVVCIGVFDSVHIGHQKIIKTAKNLANKKNIRSVVITFDPYPVEILSDNPPQRLSTIKLKERLISELGIDNMVNLPFDKNIAALSPRDFIELLMKSINIDSIIIGDNFRFGSKASGDINTLIGLGDKFGFDVIPVPLFEFENKPISTTRIKKVLMERDVGKAEKMLGRCPVAEGTVIKGAGRGKNIGIPTANISVINKGAIPADGVYGGHIKLKGDESKWMQCAISVGNQPTFNDGRQFVEAYVFDLDEDIYGQIVELQFCRFIRVQQRFKDEIELVKQIKQDVEDIKIVLSGLK